MSEYFKHESAYVDEGAEIGAGTKIWHFSHVMKGAKIGERCGFGQNVNVDGGVVIGNNVKVQNNVSIYTGTVIEDDVFLGPSCVLTNVTNPRSQVNRHSLYEKTLIRRGATIGANATIVCGVTLGRYCFVAAGSVVTKDVPDYALVMGNPARQKGWMSRHGHILKNPDADGVMTCPESGFRYQIVSNDRGQGTGDRGQGTGDRGQGTGDRGQGTEVNSRNGTEPTTEHRPPTTNQVLRCLDLDEESPLPAELARGERGYDSFRSGD